MSALCLSNYLFIYLNVCVCLYLSSYPFIRPSFSITKCDFVLHLYCKFMIFLLAVVSTGSPAMGMDPTASINPAANIGPPPKVDRHQHHLKCRIHITATDSVAKTFRKREVVALIFGVKQDFQAFLLIRHLATLPVYIIFPMRPLCSRFDSLKHLPLSIFRFLIFK